MNYIHNISNFEKVLDYSDSAIVILNSKGEFVFCNKKFTKSYGFTFEDIKFLPFEDVLLYIETKSEFKSSLEEWQKIAEEDIEETSFEIHCRTKNNNTIPTEIKIVLDRNENDPHFIVYLYDQSLKINSEAEIEKMIEELQVSKEMLENSASELIDLNQQLEESKEQLQELNASKDKFFSIIAHDLKGPFQGLLGYSEILSTDIENLQKEEVIEFAGNLHNSANHLFKLLENLLQWSRIQRGVIQHNPDEVLVRFVANQIISILEFNATNKNIELINNVDEDLRAFADVNMLNTILRNLVSNSIKFTPESGSITIDAFQENNEIIVSVADTGVGMDDDTKNKIFRIDQNHTTLGTNNEPGTGLGLVLCKDLADKNGGRLWVKSQPGEGSTFYFTLPIIEQ